MGIEKFFLAVQVYRRVECADDETAHHFAQGGYVIFRLPDPVAALYAQTRHVVSQLGQRLFVQETGEIVGSIGEKLAAADADEQVVIFLFDGGGVGLAGDLREGGYGLAEIGIVTGHFGGDLKAVSIGRFVQEKRKQPVELRPELFLCTRRWFVQNLRFAHSLVCFSTLEFLLFCLVVKGLYRPWSRNAGDLPAIAANLPNAAKTLTDRVNIRILQKARKLHLAGTWFPLYGNVCNRLNLLYNWIWCFCGRYAPEIVIGQSYDPAGKTLDLTAKGDDSWVLKDGVIVGA